MKNKILMDNNAGAFKRVIAFLVDSFIITFITTVFTQFFVFTKKNLALINESSQEFTSLFGDVRFSHIKDYHIRYIVNSPIYDSFVDILLLSFFIAILYNFLCYFFWKSSTLGQKIFSLKVANITNNEKPNALKLVLKSIMVQLPTKLLYLMVIGQFLYLINFHKYAPNNGFMTWLLSFISSISNIYTISIVIVLLSLFWYGIYFILDRLILGDILSGTRVIEKSYIEQAKSSSGLGAMDKILDYLGILNTYLSGVLKKWISMIKNAFTKKK